jgi:8-amino-7-oxononanoate synthase
MLAALQAELDQRKSDGLMRQRRLLDSPQAEHIVANDQAFLSFCSNDYLGLANHPTLIAAMQEAAVCQGWVAALLISLLGIIAITTG